jgi:Zn-dependent protease
MVEKIVLFRCRYSFFVVVTLLLFVFAYESWFKVLPGLAIGLIFAGSARFLLSITLHEYGHGLMAIALGGFCRAIELNALGGLAYCEHFSQQNPGKTGSANCSNILISIAGPAMNAIQCGLLAWSLSWRFSYQCFTLALYSFSRPSQPVLVAICFVRVLHGARHDCHKCHTHHSRHGCLHDQAILHDG